MKSLLALIAVAFGLTACQLNQIEANAIFAGAEIASTQVLAKNPTTAPLLQSLVVDWNKFQGGKLSNTDEVALLNQIVVATHKTLTPTEAAALNAATQIIVTNTQNQVAPTVLNAGAAAIVTDLMNGIARALVINGTPVPAQ